jgi:septal ring factor EnvC (AmiA/AmiB activator)
MRTSFRSAAAFALMTLLALPAPLALAAPNSTGKQARQKELDRVQARLQALNQKLEHDKTQRDALDTQIETSEKALANSRSEITRLSAELKTRESDLTKAQADRDAAGKHLLSERKALGQELRANFITGQREQVKLLLSQDTTATLGRLLTYQDYMSRARAGRVTGLKDEIERLTAAETHLKDESAKIVLARAETQTAIGNDERLQQQRNVLMAQLKERIDDEQDQVKKLEQDERDLMRVLDSIRTVMADEPVKTPAKPESDGSPARPFTQGRGRMGWPLRGSLLANYGDPKVGGKLAWKGLWIAAERGATAKASARGRVAYVGFMHRYGLIVILEHEDNYFTLYGHLDNVAVSAGDTVALGEPVGSVGDSGGNEKTGLYFEVRKGTDPLDPREWLGP